MMDASPKICMYKNKNNNNNIYDNSNDNNNINDDDNSKFQQAHCTGRIISYAINSKIKLSSGHAIAL